MSKTILAQVDGFTPMIDAVVLDVGIISAAVFGKAWRYCQMSDGVCKASQERIADELGISRITVNAHFAKLVHAGYLIDTTPDLLGLPHIYMDTGKAGVSISFTGGVNNLNTGSKEYLQGGVKNIDSKIVVKKQKEIKKTIKRPDFKSLSPEKYRTIPELKTFMDATGWIPGSFVLEVVYDFVSAGLTREQITAAFSEWTSRGYKPANVKGYLTWARDGIPAERQYRKQPEKQGDASPLEKYAASIGAI